jgi:hypothetical protein
MLADPHTPGTATAATAQRAQAEAWLVVECDYISLSRNQAAQRSGPEALNWGLLTGPIPSVESPNHSPKMSQCSSLRSSILESPRICADEGSEASQSGRETGLPAQMSTAKSRRWEGGNSLLQYWQRLKGCGIVLTRKRQVASDDVMTAEDEDSLLSALSGEQGLLSSCMTSYNVKVLTPYLLVVSNLPGLSQLRSFPSLSCLINHTAHLFSAQRVVRLMANVAVAGHSGGEAVLSR